MAALSLHAPSEMTGYMKLFVMDRDTLDIAERNLLSIAYKNVMGELRCSWRVLTHFLQKEEDETKLALTAVQCWLSN